MLDFAHVRKPQEKATKDKCANESCPGLSIFKNQPHKSPSQCMSLSRGLQGFLGQWEVPAFPQLAEPVTSLT